VAVEVQDEDRRVGRGGVDLLQRRPAALGELELAPAADHADPLRRRRAFGLRPQHGQRVGEGGDVLPPQLHVVVEAAANEVGVAVVKAGDDPPAADVDDPSVRVSERHDPGLLADRRDQTILHGQRAGGGIRPVQRRHIGVAENEVGGIGHGLSSGGA
jgi:hypothetical protein